MEIEIESAFLASGILSTSLYGGYSIESESSPNGNSVTILDRIYVNALDHITILVEGSDVTEFLVEYRREQHICDGIHLCTLKLIKTDLQVQVWDEVILYEYDIKTATFYVSNIRYPREEKAIILELQDMSKKLSDYLIDEIYDLSKPQYKDNPETLNVRYWIQKFLTLAGISYRFAVSGDGGTMGTTTMLGMQMLSDQILTLLQMAGWFIYFDADGVCVVDSILIRKNYPGYDYRLRDEQILDTKVNLDDASLRNLAVVWGNSNPQYPMVYVYKKRRTSWQIDGKDLRAVVLANGSIYSTYDANKIAQNILDTFSQAIKVKEVRFVNSPNIILADLVWIDSRTFNGVGRVTTITVEVSPAGMIHTLILDEKCPRLFAYIGAPPEDLPPSSVSFLHPRSSRNNCPNPLMYEDLNLRSSTITGSLMFVTYF